MSGHSKWHKIKHKKETTDGKKSQLFGRLSREIATLARRNADPSANAPLREAIDRAKKANVPQENIDRLLRKGSDEASAIVYEGYGPGGTAILITVVTDSTNRAVAEIRSIFKKNGGSLGTPNSVRWKFMPRTKVIAEKAADTDLEALELELIDKGATDFQVDDDQIMIIAEPTARDTIESLLDNNGLEIIESEIEHYVPPEQQTKLAPEKLEQFNKLIDELINHADVRAVHTDISY